MRVFIRESGTGSLRVIFGWKFDVISLSSLNFPSFKPKYAAFLQGFSTISAREGTLCGKSPSRPYLLRNFAFSLLNLSGKLQDAPFSKGFSTISPCRSFLLRSFAFGHHGSCLSSLNLSGRIQDAPFSEGFSTNGPCRSFLLRKFAFGHDMSGFRTLNLSGKLQDSPFSKGFSTIGPCRSFLLRKFSFGHHDSCFSSLNLSGKRKDALFSKGFSTIGAKEGNLCTNGSSRSCLLTELEASLREHNVQEAWKRYKVYKNIFGYPDKCIVSDLITESAYSADEKSLRSGCNLVVSVSREKPVLLKPDVVAKLALSLARAQLPASAASVLRVTLEKRCLPSSSVLETIFMHMVKTKIGVYLASNILGEVFDVFEKLGSNKSAEMKLTKPDTVIFNLVLDACVIFGTPFKGHQVVQLMAKVGVTADVHTALVVARIYEMIGMRDELKRFTVLLDTVPKNCDTLHQHFYDSLLSLHFKFNDFDAVSMLLIDLCRDNHGSKPCRNFERKQMKTCMVPIGSDNSKTGLKLKLQFLPLKLRPDFVCKTEGRTELILCKDGKAVLSKKGLAKLITMYQKSGRINEHSKLLASVENMVSSSNTDVIDVFIHLGWLETAHDILDDMEVEKCRAGEGSYARLLAAYRSRNMLREAEALEKQIKIAHSFDESHIFCSVDKMASGAKDLAKFIIRNMKEEEQEVIAPPSVHEFNSSICFFSKAGMMEDAKEMYRKMQKLGIHPNPTTYYHLICGYSASELYREITFLWGDIKRSNNNSLHDRDLYELLLVNFLRGGYFERVTEIVGLMNKSKMFTDKDMCKTEFLKLHRNLYWKLNPADAKDETQKRRILQVQAFRKFVGIG